MIVFMKKRSSCTQKLPKKIIVKNGIMFVIGLKWVLLLVQATSPAFALHKLHIFVFYLRRLKEDVRIGLPSGWREGMGEERTFMKGKCVLLID